MRYRLKCIRSTTPTPDEARKLYWVYTPDGWVRYAFCGLCKDGTPNTAAYTFSRINAAYRDLESFTTIKDAYWVVEEVP